MMLAFSQRTPARSAEELQVLGGAVGDDGDVRLGDLRQVADLADVVRAHLEDEVLVIFLGGENRERHADVVVEALGRHRALELHGRAPRRSGTWCWSCRCCRRRRRPWPAACCGRASRACRGQCGCSGTTMQPQIAGGDAGTSETIAAIAPRGGGGVQKSCPSKRSPLSATNSEPGFIARVSVQTAATSDPGRRQRPRRSARHRAANFLEG